MRVLHELRRRPRPTAGVALLLFVLATIAGTINTCANALPAAAAHVATAHGAVPETVAMHAQHAASAAHHEHASASSVEQLSTHADGRQHSSGTPDPHPACPHCTHGAAAPCPSAASCGTTSAGAAPMRGDEQTALVAATPGAPLSYQPPSISPPEPRSRGSGVLTSEPSPYRRCSLNVLFCVFLK